MIRTYIVFAVIAFCWIVFVPLLTCCKYGIDWCFGFSRPWFIPWFPLMEPKEKKASDGSNDDDETPFLAEQKEEFDAPGAKEESEATSEELSCTTPCVPWCSYCMWYCIVSTCLSIFATIVVLLALQIWINSTFPPLEAVPPSPPTQVQTAVASFNVALESEPTDDQVNKVKEGILAELNKSNRKLEETGSETYDVEVLKQQAGAAWELVVTVTSTRTVESSSTELDTTGLDEFESSVESDVATTTQQVDTIVADASDGQLAVTNVGEVQVQATVEMECNDVTDAQLQKVIEPWSANLAGYGISKNDVEKHFTCRNVAKPDKSTLDEMNKDGSQFKGYIDEFNNLAGNDIVKLPDGKLETFCNVKLRRDPEDIELAELCQQSCNFGQCGQISGAAGARKLEY